MRRRLSMHFAWVLIAFSLIAGCDRGAPAAAGGGFVPIHRTLYVINGLAETLSAIDLVDGTIAANLLVLGRWPNSLVAGESSGTLFVVNSGDNQVVEMSVAEGSALRTLDVGVGQNPWECGLEAGEIWVSSFLTGEVSIFRLEEGGAPAVITPGGTLQALRIEGETVYVTDTRFQYGDFGTGRVVAIDRIGRTVLGEVDVGTNPQGLLPDGAGRLDVLCTGGYGEGDVRGEVHRIDSAGLVPLDTLALGGSPSAMCRGTDGVVYVAGYDGGVLSYDPATFLPIDAAGDPLLAGDGYSDIVSDGESGLLYVAEFDRDRVLAVRPGTGEIVSTYDVGDGPVRLQIVDP